MREDWNIKPLGEIGKVSMCKRILKKQTNPVGGIPFYKIGTFGKEANAFISEEIYNEYKNRYSFPKKGDILLSASGTIGRRVIYDGLPAYFQDSNIVWIDNHEEEVLNEYLYKFYGFCDWNPSRGATISRLYNDDLRRILIPIPSHSEQKQIVAILDQAFAAIDQAQANIQQNIQNAQDLFQSKLNQIFSQQGEGWEEKTLKEISVDFGRGKSKHRPRNDPSLYGGKYPFIQTGDVRNSEHLITTYSTTYNSIGLKQSKLWPKGTICITIAANIAETGILNFPACFPDSIIGIVVDEELTSNSYVEFLLQSMKTRIQAKGKGSAQANINLGTFEKELFPFQKLHKQHEIIKQLKNLTTSITYLTKKYQNKISSLEELKKSLLQKAFNGELTQNKQVA